MDSGHFIKEVTPQFSVCTRTHTIKQAHTCSQYAHVIHIEKANFEENDGFNHKEEQCVKQLVSAAETFNRWHSSWKSTRLAQSSRADNRYCLWRIIPFGLWPWWISALDTVDTQWKHRFKMSPDIHTVCQRVQVDQHENTAGIWKWATTEIRACREFRERSIYFSHRAHLHSLNSLRQHDD